jgi:hypothetical protein
MNLGTHSVSQNKSHKANARVSVKPPAQKMRVKALHVAGVSNRKIAKIENLANNTVNRIVKEPDVAEYVKKLREQLYAVGDEALEAVRAQLAVKKDGHLGYKVLEGLGIVPKKDQVPVNPDIPADTPRSGYERQAFMVANVLLEAHEQMGVDLPEGALERMAEGQVLDVESKKVKE